MLLPNVLVSLWEGAFLLNTFLLRLRLSKFYFIVIYNITTEFMYLKTKLS